MAQWLRVLDALFKDRLDSQQPHGCPQSAVIPATGDLTLSFGLHRLREVSGEQTYMQTKHPGILKTKKQTIKPLETQ